jgi:hypothetical protein
MVGFGTSKKQGVEDFYGASSKENTSKNIQPRAAVPSSDDPLYTSGKPNMQDYVDSMDAAFPAGARCRAQPEGNRTAKATRNVPAEHQAKLSVEHKLVVLAQMVQLIRIARQR